MHADPIHEGRARTRSGRRITMLLLALGAVPGRGDAAKPRFATPTHSTTIALTAKDKLLLVVNRETNTLSVLLVRGKKGADASAKLAEIPVGVDPRCVAVDPGGKFAWVTNAVSGTVSVVSLAGKTRFSLVAEIPVGTEPRGCALTPNGTRLFVANFTGGTVSVIDTAARAVVQTVPVDGRPFAVAITNDNDKKDDDETVFVTQFFSELIAGKEEPFDDARQGVVWAFPSGALNPIAKITLSPLATSGFTADRSKFCNGTTDPDPHSEVYCPSPTITDPTNPAIAMDPQGAYPNLLQSAVIRGHQLYLPNIGAAPEPPVKFNVNVQALVHVVDTTEGTEQTDRHVNLNNDVKAETAPADPTTSLDRLFGNDLAAIDATRDGKVFLIVSRGGNFVFRGTPDATGKLSLGTPVVRFQTGNVPDGVVVSQDGKRAYVNNEVNVSVTALDLEHNTVLARDIASGTPPAPGTFAHGVLVGKLVFFTALGTPNDGLVDTPIRDIVPLGSRGKASDNAWSSCAACHPDGLTDNVTWSFPDGPRQTLPLDAFFAKDNPADQRISNWSAVRGSVTDFNNNSRAVQGGKGFAGDPPNPNIYNHGITQGASDALDLMTLWVQTVRTLNQAQPADVTAGRTVFEDHCASCHGGAKWTKSQTLYADDPAFTADPLSTVPGVPRDPGVTALGGGQIQSYTVGTASIVFLDAVGTFDPLNPLEMRGAGGKIGDVAAGAAGFNTPSLLGVANNAPYFHDGSAQTLDDVFAKHQLTEGVTTTIAGLLSSGEKASLKTFLTSIDGRTVQFRSAADDFRDLVAGGP
jgi:YVTN family beta-propeller protein